MSGDIFGNRGGQFADDGNVLLNAGDWNDWLSNILTRLNNFKATLGQCSFFQGINLGTDSNTIPYVYSEDDNINFRYKDGNGNTRYNDIRQIVSNQRCEEFESGTILSNRISNEAVIKVMFIVDGGHRPDDAPLNKEAFVIYLGDKSSARQKQIWIEYGGSAIYQREEFNGNLLTDWKKILNVDNFSYSNGVLDIYL